MSISKKVAWGCLWLRPHISLLFCYSRVTVVIYLLPTCTWSESFGIEMRFEVILFALAMWLLRARRNFSRVFAVRPSSRFRRDASWIITLKRKLILGELCRYKPSCLHFSPSLCLSLSPAVSFLLVQLSFHVLECFFKKLSCYIDMFELLMGELLFFFRCWIWFAHARHEGFSGNNAHAFHCV